MRKSVSLKTTRSIKKRAGSPLKAVGIKVSKVTRLSPGRKASKVAVHKKRAIVLRKKAA